jgi:uncharacterized protein (TIGR02453 family)
MAFFSQDYLLFFQELAANNNKDWFDINRKRYEKNVKVPFSAFTQHMIGKFNALDPSFNDLLSKDCVFRINRDIRFSKDKSPYKTNIGIWFTQNKFSKNSPGYYIHFEKGKSFIAGGVWCPESNELKRIRKEITFFYEDLEAIINDKKFKSEYGELTRDDNNTLKKAPKDFHPNHPAIEFLKLKSFTATKKIDDKLFLDPNFSKIIAKKLIILKPINDFLNRALETEE